MTDKLLSRIAIFTLLSCDHPSPEKARERQRQNEKRLSAIQSFKSGKVVFTKHCSTCHRPPEKSAKDAYFFDHIFERLPSPPVDYFIKYIQDSKELEKTGDPYANKLSAEYKNSYEHYFKDTLSQQDLQDLIIYIQVGPKLKETNSK